MSPTVSITPQTTCIMLPFFTRININFNATKNKLIVYGRNDVHVEFQGQTIPTCSDEFHVGNLVMSNPAVD